MDEEGVVFTPEAFERHDAALHYINNRSRTRNPRGRGTRYPRIIAHAWGLLAAGGTITALVGKVPGVGVVKLCDRAGTVPEDTPDTNVLNAGTAIMAGADTIVPLEWVEGDWVACGCGVAPTGTVTCDPCNPPKRDLHIKYSFYWILNNDALALPPVSTHIGDVEGTLTYSSTGSNFWQSQWAGDVMCPDGIARHVVMICEDLSGLGESGTLTFTGPGSAKVYTSDPGGVWGSWDGGSMQGGVGQRMQNRDEMVIDSFDNACQSIIYSYACTPIHAKWESWYLAEYGCPTAYAGYAELSDPTPGLFVPASAADMALRSHAMQHGCC